MTDMSRDLSLLLYGCAIERDGRVLAFDEWPTDLQEQYLAAKTGQEQRSRAYWARFGGVNLTKKRILDP